MSTIDGAIDFILKGIGGSDVFDDEAWFDTPQKQRFGAEKLQQIKDFVNAEIKAREENHTSQMFQILSCFDEMDKTMRITNIKETFECRLETVSPAILLYKCGFYIGRIYPHSDDDEWSVKDILK